MSEAPRGQLVYDGVISRRRGDAKEVAFAPEAKRKEKLRPLRVARMLALAHECEALITARVSPTAPSSRGCSASRVRA